MTIESFSDVYSDERISSIVVIDDFSSMEIFDKLKKYCEMLPKVNLGRNLVNVDCYQNKRNSAYLSESEWVVIFDSDNRLNTQYIDAIFKENWDEKTMYCPTFAHPTFDYRDFSGLTITKDNVNDYMDKPLFETALNTFNLFINREEYLRVWDVSVDPVTSDSIYFAYCWLKAGNKIKFVEGMEYEHRVHSGSHYLTQNHRTGNFHEKVLESIRNLSNNT